MRRYLAPALEITVPIALLVLWGVWSASAGGIQTQGSRQVKAFHSSLWSPASEAGSSEWSSRWKPDHSPTPSVTP